MILAFTGAGVSKDSGIPTFVDQGDMRTKLDRTYYRMHKQEVEDLINGMYEVCSKAEPNDAHKALAEYNIPIITMNVDGLHQRAGSKHVLAIHGELPDSVVLYGDPAPLYSDAINLVYKLRPGDKLLIVGVSFYTLISEQIRAIAKFCGADVFIINENAKENVRAYLNNNNKSAMSDYDEFMSREAY